MALTFETPNWKDYQMVWHRPHEALEPLENEIAVIDAALDALVDAEILPRAQYDPAKFSAHRQAVRERFEIPWTAITPRMQRLIYAINAIRQPRTLVAVGIFCGNTFISNAGAALGPGSVYQAESIVGLEIKPGEADRARRNVNTLATHGARVAILGEDGIPWLKRYTGSIDLLYLDADGPQGRGKSIYLDLLEAGLHTLREGSLVLAHNSVNCAQALADYLDYVRDPQHFRQSMNMIVDDQGLEVSLV